jgi:hypothetical protein
MKQIAFIFSRFPIPTQIRVAEEIRLLMERFPGSRIYCLKPVFDVFLFGKTLELMAFVQYVESVFSWEVLNSNLRWFLKRPGTYIKVLLSLIFRAVFNPLLLMKTFYFYPQAIRLASLMESEGMDHLHSHGAEYPRAVAWTVSRLLGVPFSYTSDSCHGSMSKALAEQARRNTDITATCTEDAPGFEGLDRIWRAATREGPIEDYNVFHMN